jgi:hypothetical protein
MNKTEALERCLYYIKEYGYISEDGVSDECEDKRSLINYCIEELNKMVSDGRLNDEQWEIL